MPRRLAYLVPLLIGLALSVIVAIGLLIEEDRHIQESRLDVFYNLSTIQNGLESGLNSRLHLADAARSFVLLKPDMDQAVFAAMAKGLLGDMGGIRYLEFAKDNVISHVYPEDGAKAVMGRNLLRDFPVEIRKLAIDVMEARQTRISTPVSVLEGGEAIILATPVYVPGSNGSNKYWGMILMLVDIKTLFRHAGLTGTPSFDIALRAPGDVPGQGRMLYGKESVYAMRPVTMNVSVPGGYWQVAAVPKGDWTLSPRRDMLLYGGGIAVLSVTGLLYLSLFLFMSHFKEREKYRQLVQSVRSIILRIDTEGIISFCNEYAEEFYGYSPGELIGKPLVGTLIHETNLSGKSSGRYIEQLLKNPSAHPFNETVNVCRNGEMVWVAWANQPVMDSSGKPVELLCVGTDITDRKIMEEAIKVNERQYRLLAENVTDIIIGLDADLHYTFISPSDERLRGFARYEVLGRAIGDFLTPQSDRALTDALAKLTRNVSSTVSPPHTTLDLEFTCADDTTVWLETQLGLLLNENAEVIGMQGVARDISDRKRAEALRDDVERMARHDLKTPLGAVVGLPEEIRRRGELNSVQENMLATIEQAGETMLELINSSLDLFKMECGTYTLNKADVNLLGVFDSVKDEVRTIIREKGVSIGVEVVPPVSDGRFMAHLEEKLLRSMLSNLITNALQASPGGGSVTVSFSKNDHIAIRLRNQGEVSKEMREIFFDKYATTKDTGVGLGTYSARLMARTMGGDISLDTSAAGETSVVVTLPL